MFYQVALVSTGLQKLLSDGTTLYKDFENGHDRELTGWGFFLVFFCLFGWGLFCFVS